jgi:hypothetical protein
VFEAVRHDSQGERLDLGDSLVLAGALGEDAGQLDDLCYPAAVGLLLQLDTKSD